jgi:alpha-D-ribose 1-methylphosphonate 5-triphosphate synthase subunit PhnG
MRLLALAEWNDLDARSRDVTACSHEVLRKPETGLVMLRGRIGATGAPFNLGEATVTRCAIRLSTGEEGHAYILGRNADHARRAALCDALLQRPEHGDRIRQMVLAPIAGALQARRQRAAGKAAATKVDFFTLVRGDD